MPSIVTKPLVNPADNSVYQLINVSSTTRSWLVGGINYIAVSLAIGQVAAQGYQFTPLNSSAPWEGGTFAPPQPVYPPIGDLRVNAVAAINATVNEKIDATGDQRVNALRLQRAITLDAKKATEGLSPNEQVERDAITAVWAGVDKLTYRAENLTVLANAVTDPQWLMDLIDNPLNPPDGLGWPA